MRICILLLLLVLPIKSYASDYMDQVACLALNIYHEARGESTQGQKAVAWVTLNRVNSPKFPNTICEVVKQRKQFSWYWQKKDKWPHEREIFLRIWNLAEQVKNQYRYKSDPTYGSLFYHADYVNPYWSKHFERTAKIGKHIFYRSN